MGLLITKDDFTGVNAISKSISSNIDAYIAEWEERYLVELLGASLFKLFKADVNGTTKIPNTLIYQNIYNAIAEDYSILYLGCDSNIIISRGMKEMLVAFIWYQFIVGEKYRSTNTGIVVDSNEVSRNNDFTEGNVFVKYNTAVKDYNSIQQYIIINSVDYPLYNGLNKSLMSRL